MFLGLVSRRFDMLPGQPGPEPIRLRTLILLRWIAIAGQSAALAGALLIGTHLRVLPILLVIGMALVLNLVLSLRPARRIGASEAGWQLGFDLAQIAGLLSLTGGLSNPFALLLLAPVTVAATALPGRQLIALGTATLIMVSMAAFLARPLSFSDAPALPLNEPLVVGTWSAIVIGALFFALYARTVTTEIAATSDALFAARMALEREQRLQHLGGVVAAAAHEMGTPLATIKLVSSELGDELVQALPDRVDLAEDLQLLRQSADRCSAILKSMGSAGRDDLLIRSAPLPQVLEEAAGPHRARGIRIRIEVAHDAPVIQRDAAMIHGVRNLVQNAVDFASAEVMIEAGFDMHEIRLRIADDGPGFPPALLPKIGDPFLTTRARAEDRRGYEGMGLGLFIAKVLLERSGAVVRFSNRKRGAQASVTWPRARIEAGDRGRLGENPEIRA
ncbi:MAG: ActS/PrrB/RegB family redox-sensitive histidine kinase [Paracoccus sp. (in: a-proteobacteria)]|uniref:ActS/PrrB/RegB family redox-sensitive histidine kinase n=1 Tax=Paracoccus sp. TaxID=267 RepID=UPI0039E7104B